ncbi:MAG: SLC13 family permease [Candidatus Asgardarchaeia archaeon]
MEIWAIIILSVFIATLFVIITEKIDKAIATILGAIIVYLTLSTFKGATLDEILSFIDWPTIIIMFSVIVTGILVNEAGLFQWVAIKLVKLTVGDLVKIFFSLIMLTIILSSVITILVSAIIIARLTISITEAIDVDPYPFLLAEAIAVGIGGATSLVASPNTILVAQFAHLDFTFFLIYTMPISIIAGLCTTFILIKISGSLGEVSEVRKSVLMEFEEWSVVPDLFLFYASAIILIAMIIGFAIFPAPYVVAITVAAVFLLIRRKSLSNVAKDVDWSTLFFFMGIFIIVGGVEKTGVLHEIGYALGTMSKGNVFLPLVLIIWITGISSGFLDGVTIVLTFTPIIAELVKSGGFQNFFLIFMIALVLSTNFGGSMTPIGTPASLLIVSLASERGIHISFKEFIKVGVIVVAINLTLATLYAVVLMLIY